MNRYKETNIASILGIVGNIMLMSLKGVIGFTSNSQAMIADFFNSFGDVFSSFMTFIGNKISSKEADEDHNLGHGKAEYIYAFLISIIIFTSKQFHTYFSKRHCSCTVSPIRVMAFCGHELIQR